MPVKYITTKLVDNAEPLRFRITSEGRLEKGSDLLIDQLRAIDNRRLVDGPLLRCPLTLMAQIDRCVTEVIGL